ncbi:MAG: DUF975 family protein [Clostridia bacterium]|nr:DUF975 family protein [Clostridia bacterium]
MFDRKVLKTRAKSVLATSYWQIFGTMLLFSLATTFIDNFFSPKIPPTITLASPRVIALFGVTMFIRLILQFAATVFLTLPLQVGLNKYLIDSAKGGVPGIDSFAYAFRSNYKSVISVVFAKQIIIIVLTVIPVVIAGVATVYILARSGVTFPTTINTAHLERLTITLSESPEYLALSLAMLVLLIPAIVKMYDYYLVEYIIAEDSSLSWREALDKSKKLMKGNRFSVFVLGLSFLGWQFLGLLAFGIGSVFVTPYILATDAQLYLELSGKSTFDF